MSNADRIRAKFALAHARQSVEHDCPSPEQVLAWHEKALDATQATVMQAHVAQCELCFALWSGLVDLEPDQVSAPSVQPGRRWWHFGVPAMALGAIAVSVWIGFLNPPPLTAYSLDIRGGLEMRGGDASPLLVLRDDTLLRVIVAPASAVDERIEAAGYAQTPAGLVPLPTAMAVTDKGVASLEALVGQDVRRDTGVERLVFVVGREGRLPDAEALSGALGEQAEVTREHWQAFAVDVTD